MSTPAATSASAEDYEKRIADLIQKKPPSDVHNVFYESKKNPYAHFPRQVTDGEFRNCIKNGTSMLVYGGAYTGKTFLVTHNLKEAKQEYIKIDCFEDMTIDQVYTQILRNIGYLFETSFTTSTSATTEVTASASASLLDVAVFETNGKIASEDNTEIVRATLPLCLTNPNDIVTALRGMKFTSYIVLGMFNKLPLVVQNCFISHLRTFLEAGLKLVIVYTGTDTTPFKKYIEHWPNRFVTFDQDNWSDSDLKGYMDYCAQWLKIEFSTVFRNTLLEKANGHFWLVRKACHIVCLKNGIHNRQAKQITIGSAEEADEIITSILIDKTDSYEEYKDILDKTISDTDKKQFEQDLMAFAAGLRKGNNHLYKWILFPVITATSGELQDGIPQTVVVRKIKARHHNNPKASQILEALEKIEKLQKEKCSRILLSYGEDGKGGHVLRIVDRTFRVWLFFRNREELCNAHDLPTDLFDQT